LKHCIQNLFKSTEYVLPSGFIFQQHGALIILSTIENMAQNIKLATNLDKT